MSEGTFEPGDVVILKSGGPRMTVEGDGGTVNSIALVSVKWFNPDGSGGLYSQNVPKSMLKHATAKQGVGFHD